MTKYIKKLIILCLVLIICISSFPLSVGAATTYNVSCSDCYDSNGKLIVANNQVGNLYAGTYEGYYKIGDNRVYCIELNVPFTTSDNYIVNTSSASSTWQKLGKDKKDLINSILSYGLEGSNRTNVGYKTVGGRSVYFVKMYGYTVTLYEAYLATQLLIWEVTEGYRPPNKPYTSTKYNLYKAYSGTAGTNIKNIYNAIVDEVSKFNDCPTFTAKSPGNAPTYNFDVSYNPTNGYKINSTNKVLTDTKKVLSHYPDLASNRSISFKGYKNETKYLNVTASLSGNKLTLKPASITDTAKYTTSKSVSALEDSVPTTAVARLIAYGESSSKNIQDLVCGGYVDPIHAYYKLAVNYEYEKSNRNFRIVKSARDTSGNEIDIAKSGWYFYVKLPTVNAPYEKGTKTSFKYYDSTTDSVLTTSTYSQNFASYFGSTKMKLCKNNYDGAGNAKGEYYLIFGPTNNAEGQTATILTYIRRYIDASCSTSDTSLEVPYGNYYIYELGQKTSDFTATDTINGDTSTVDMDPNHYAIPDGYTSYYYTYKEHTAGDYRNGIDDLSNADEKEYQHYKHLKRVNCTYNQSDIKAPINVNYCSTKVRIQKTSEDGNISNVYFKISTLNSSGTVTKQQTVGPTNKDGYIERWLECGTYKIEELGYGIPSSMPAYSKLPDPITITINSETFMQYYDNGYYQIDFVNTANANIRVFKSDTGDSSKYLRGAVYGIYSSEGKLLEELPPTDTVTVGNVTFNGYSQSVNKFAFGEYYIQEISAPDGYLVDETQYPIILSYANMDRDIVSGIPILRNRISVNVSDDPTSTYISKTDITGQNELSGAKLNVKLKGDTNIIDEWISTTEPHKIEGLLIGKTYVLTETISPNGYATTNSIEFTIEEDGITQVNMKDDTTKYSFLKTDEKGNGISNVHMQLLDDKKAVIEDWITDGSAYKVDGKLIVGKTYTLHEVSPASPSYKLADDITFTVSDTSERKTITMINSLYYGSVTLNKQDGEGNALSGAEFELYKDDIKLSLVMDSKGNYSVADDGKETTLSTDSIGQLNVSNLELGEYYFIEITTPEGKMPYTDKIRFTIANDTEETLNPKIVVKNDTVVMLSTGGSGFTIGLTIGFVLLLLSASVLIIYNKTYRNKAQQKK